MTSLPILGSRLFTSTPLINSADLVTDIREFIKRFFTNLKFTLPTLRLLPSTSAKCRLCLSSVCDVLNSDFLKSSFLKKFCLFLRNLKYMSEFLAESEL